MNLYYFMRKGCNIVRSLTLGHWFPCTMYIRTCMCTCALCSHPGNWFICFQAFCTLLVGCSVMGFAMIYLTLKLFDILRSHILVYMQYYQISIVTIVLALHYTFPTTYWHAIKCICTQLYTVITNHCIWSCQNKIS